MSSVLQNYEKYNIIESYFICLTIQNTLDFKLERRQMGYTTRWPYAGNVLHHHQNNSSTNISSHNKIVDPINNMLSFFGLL
jgi:hypothetical protein